jgi:ABC-2 type transport system permease protein
VIDGGTQGLARTILWSVAVVTYGAFWLGLAVLVNAQGLRASTNAVVLAGLWLVIVVLAPSVINLASRVAHPVPSRVQFATAIRAATRDAMVEGSRQLGRFLEDHPAAGTGREGMQQYALLQATRDRAIAARAEPLRTVYDRQLAEQRRFVGVAQFVSPTVMMQMVLTDIAGTSGVRHRGFYDQVSSFQQRWSAALTPKIMAVSALTPVDIERLPTFAFVEEPPSAVAQRNRLPLTGLVILTVVVWWSAVRRYSQYQVVER